jgi:multimeric flavodoxin WrbA
MKTLDDGKEGISSKEEQAKLIQEMKTLIKKKGLEVDLIPRGSYKIEEPVLASGCTGCTVCPCMICW